METYGCIDNALNSDIYYQFIEDTNLTPYMYDKRHYFKNYPMYPDLNWSVGFDSPYKSDTNVVYNAGTTAINNFIFITPQHPYHRKYLNVVINIINNYFNMFNCIDILRMRINMSLNSRTSDYLHPHVDDFTNQHLSFTLFLGKSDGDHIVFNETDPYIYRDNKQLTEAARYSHMENRLVWNKGHYHTSYNPVDHIWRLSFNFVVRIEE